MKKVGLHIKFEASLQEVVEKAARLQLPFFQCFLVKQQDKKLYEPTTDVIEQFVTLCKRFAFTQMFLHSSYYSNLCSNQPRHTHLFEQELRWAVQLGFTHVVVHAGAYLPTMNRQAGIALLAQRLDWVLTTYKEVVILVENTAHGGRAIGSDLNDLAQLLAAMQVHDRIQFCLDTAHAYVFGYPIDTSSGQDEFFALVEKTIGLQRIGLIHLNNTKRRCGSFIDEHASLTDGIIPYAMLTRFVQYPALQSIPIILEFPHMLEIKEKEMLERLEHDI